jgi:hypothetical protein
MNRGHGLGTRAVATMEALDPDAEAITLYAREPSLVAFYERMDYYELDPVSRLMIKDLV